MTAPPRRTFRTAPAALALALLLQADTSSAAPSARAGDLDKSAIGRAIDRAGALSRLRTLIVVHRGRTVAERTFRGPGPGVPVNVKSVSKSVISALVGVAIARGHLEGTGQAIATVLGDRMPRAGDPRLREITIEHLLTMRAGLERTSGRNYGRWIASADWVRHALSQPFVDAPGGLMLYSTGNTHLLSAILTRVTGRSTLDLARDWLGGPLGIDVPPWQRDPQGIFLGGNNMTLSPRALARFGELMRNDGVLDGRRILPTGWVRETWTARTRSRYTGAGYGYGWFMAEVCGEDATYARGFGGQYVFVVPGRALTVVMTSDPTVRSRVDGYRTAQWRVLTEVVAAAPPFERPAVRVDARYDGPVSFLRTPDLLDGPDGKICSG